MSDNLATVDGAPAPDLPATKVLCMRTCNSDMTSYGGFQWPKEGVVEAPDWNPEPCCGYGLHGLLWGEGHGDYLSFAEDAIWLIFEADAADIIDIGGKIKVPRATVLKVGGRDEVTGWLAERAPGRAIVSGTATAGDRGTATAGDRGTATAGYRGCIVLKWWNGSRYRWALGEIGETADISGAPLEPNVAYRLNHEGAFVRADVTA